MADDTAPMETVATPPKQSPIKPAMPAAPAAGAPAAPQSVITPRRPTLRRPGEAPKPVTLKPPAAGTPVVQPLSQTANIAKGIEISHADAAKKVTSRISVSSATSPIPPISAAAPAAPAATPLSPATAPAAPAVSEKKITSRITLESAFTAPTEMPSPIQPKTIKLKRPGAPTIPSPAAAPSPISPAAPAAPLPPGMTPITDAEQPAASADEPLTRRKTIKVKRPGAAAPKLQLSARPDGIATEEDNLQALSNFGAQLKPQAEPDTVNPIFIVAAVAAAVVSSLLIWTLASQTFGQRGAAGDFAMPKGPQISPPPWLQQVD